jgi:CheY-like chemotaxis protein
LLDGLLDISRLDAHAVKLRLAPVDIAALLDALKDEYAGIAKAHGLTLAVELEAEAELLWALTDADQLNRVLGNLVDNALKFTAQGGVVLSTQRTAAGQVLVQVTDTGPGIAPEEQERVFDEFYQAGNPSRDRSQGLGLGLAIVRRTAALLQIGLRLASAPGQGTTFEVSLAATKPDPNETSTLPSPDASAALSVLLVDDEPDVVSSLCRYLCEIGWAAEGAANGAEAEAILARGFSADVLVVDYRLRDETCVELIARLRVRCGQVPVVVVTGDSRTQGLRELEGLAAAILHKPVDGAALSGALVEAVRRQPGA